MNRYTELLLVTLAAIPVLIVSLVVAAVVRLMLGPPVLFVQQRSGLRGTPFRMVKFRSMEQTIDADGRLLPDAARLSAFGRALRASSLDELPSLWNVIRGEMALVGPRPLLPEYLPRYNARQARRLEVRPGITGWAQVHGRNTLSWPERLELDAWYVEHRSTWLDLRILWMTIGTVLGRRGIAHEGSATMRRFGVDDE